MTWKMAAGESGYSSDKVARGEAKLYADQERLPWPPEDVLIATSMQQILDAFPPKPTRKASTNPRAPRRGFR